MINILKTDLIESEYNMDYWWSQIGWIALRFDDFFNLDKNVSFLIDIIKNMNFTILNSTINFRYSRILRIRDESKK